jgi:type I restriction-modification system DNA methylase subunit
MNRDQARALVRDTFTHSFDKANFRNFTINLLNRFDESKAFFCNSTYVKDAFKEHVSRFERLGTYTSPESEKLDVLIVHLTDGSKLERARTAIRNFVADHLKQRDNKDAALVAFVSPTEQQWRFSYVKMEYATVQKESGKIGVESRLTPARRFSYIVGEGESCHTAQTRFLDLLQDTEDNPTLARIEDAFSVETVTKEFFAQYRKLFEDINAALEKLAVKDKTIRDEFQKKHVSTVDFTKKLMGQVVFLHFLQKKGWLGVEKGKDWGTGPHDFLRRLADSRYGAYDNFFNDILEPLFYDILAIDRGHEAWCTRFKCRIPFLNGGLFEPLGDYSWERTDIILPNKLFTNSEFDEEGITGTGVLDVFDRYNFTVNEAEPLEKEVAIDPEMLGKVFENLIEDNRRKGLGSYYTPREIVHYMCQESLINYLDTSVNTPKENVPLADLETFVHLGDQISHYEAVDTRYVGREMPKKVKEHAKLIDEKLADITVCDPAVGSGAFPVGMMTEIVRARSALTSYFKDPHERSPYFFKRHAIQACLYGVDIDPGAVEIAKLRLWLSLVVDEEDVKQIKPLPNLFYKIVTGNSLLGVEKNLFNEQLFRRLEELKPRYFDEPDKDKKDRYKQQIEDTIHELTNGKEAFDFEIYFSEVFHRKGGFDVVIANPPYVRQENIKELKPALKAAGYECFNGTADLLVYFYERAVNLLCPGGSIAFITSNKYYRAGYGEKLRGYLARELTLNRLIDFGDAPVFEAIAYASILTGTRNPPSKSASALAYTWEQGQSFDRITQIVAERGQRILQSELKPNGWRLESPAVLRLLEKLRKAGTPLGEYVNGRFYRGILTGLNEAFVINRTTHDRLIREHKSAAEILKPFLRGRDVKRWRIDFAEQYLIKIESSENKDHPWSGKPQNEAEKIFAKSYPSIYRHLQSLRDIKLEKPDARGCRNKLEQLKRRDDQGKFFWELRSCIYWQEFEESKIVIPAIASDVEYAADYGKHFSNDKTSICVTTKPNYPLGLLNSNALWWFIRQTAASRLLTNPFLLPPQV